MYQTIVFLPLLGCILAGLISLAAGLLTTRSTQQSNLPVQFLQQMLSHPRSLAVAAGRGPPLASRA